MSGSRMYSEDELQNVDIADDQRTTQNNEMKISKRDYTGYDDDEFISGNETKE